MGDIYAMVPLLIALKNKNPNCKITLFTFDETKKCAHHLDCIDSVATLDRLHFLTLKKSEIYSKAFALDFLYDSVGPLIESHWDLVVNYSNDSFSTYLATLVTNTNYFCGIKYDIETGTLTSSSNWVSTFNEYATTTPFSFVHTVDFFINDLGLNQSLEKYNPFRTSPSLDKQAEISFQKIKTLEKETGRNVLLVGIQFKTSRKEKDINYNLATEIINEILESKKFYPIIITAPSEEEKEIAKKLNSYFNNRLVIVECDLFGLPSILKSLDYLICPDTAVKHMADLCNLPTVELSLGPSPIFKQGSRNEKSIVLSDDVWSRNFSSKLEKNNPTSISAKDVMAALLLISTNYLDTSVLSTTNTNFFRPQNTNFGVIYKLIAGKRESYKEISMAVIRKYCVETFEGETTKLDLEEFSSKETLQWAKSQMSNLALALKDILNILRSLKLNERGFIKNLDDLLNRNNEFMISTISIALFKFKLENMINDGVAVNQIKIEKELFHLKTQIQFATVIAKELIATHNLSGLYEESRNY